MTIVLQGCYDAVYTLLKSYLIAFIVTLMFILIVEVRIDSCCSNYIKGKIKDTFIGSWGNWEGGVNLQKRCERIITSNVLHNRSYCEEQQ